MERTVQFGTLSPITTEQLRRHWGVWLFFRYWIELGRQWQKHRHRGLSQLMKRWALLQTRTWRRQSGGYRNTREIIDGEKRVQRHIFGINRSIPLNSRYRVTRSGIYIVTEEEPEKYAVQKADSNYRAKQGHELELTVWSSQRIAVHVCRSVTRQNQDNRCKDGE